MDLSVLQLLAPATAGIIGLLGLVYKTLTSRMERLELKIESFVTEEKVRMLISERAEVQKLQIQYLSNAIAELKQSQESFSFKLDKILEIIRSHRSD